MKIDVYIERLVLDVDPGDVPRVRRSLQRELARLLRRGGLSRELRDGGALPSIRGGSIGSPAKRDTASFGSRLAHAVYEGIGDRT